MDRKTIERKLINHNREDGKNENRKTREAEGEIRWKTNSTNTRER